MLTVIQTVAALLGLAVPSLAADNRHVSGVASGHRAPLRSPRFWIAAAVLCGGVLGANTNAGAATFVVNSSADTDGSCGTTCTLRQALNGAGASKDAGNSISFDATAFAGTRQIITLGANLPAVVTNLSISAPAAGVVIAAGGNTYGLRVNSGTVTLSNLTFRGGSYGVFTVGGTTNLQGCTLSGSGTALSNGATLTARNCTLFGNSSYGAFNGSGTLTLQNCTVTGNATGIGNFMGTLSVSNSLVAGNTTTNVSGSISDGGFNIFSGTATQAGLQTDAQGNPVLADNSGPTQTVALLSSSSAVDAGNSALTTDQRGFKRPVLIPNKTLPSGGNGSDIGSFEVGETSQSGSALVVNVLDDHNDGVCGASDCTLREAISAANTFNNRSSNAGASVSFDAGVFSSAQTLTLSLGELPLVSSNITITGTTAGVTISGNKKSRLFYVSGSATLALSNLSLSNGSGTNSSNTGTNNGNGGAIFNDGGTLTLANVTLSGNSASSAGGALFNKGTLNLSNDTFSGNSAGTYGGGLYNTGTANLSNVTLSGNSAGFGGGDIGNEGGLNLSNSILNSPSGNSTLYNYFGSVSDNGYNLARDDGGGVLTASTDLLNTDPRFDTNGLRNNSGPTPTLALLPTSPAIDAGNSPLSTDQRGSLRPVLIAGRARPSGGNGSDIGSFELDPAQSGSALLVNTIADHDDGNCGTGDCTLREAVHYASSGATISFAPSVFSSQQIIRLTQDQLPVVSSKLTITGPSMGVTVDAGGRSRILFVASGANVSLSNLTLSYGNGDDANNTSAANGSGGAIFNAGTLSLLNVTLNNNNTDDGGETIGGGALCNFRGAIATLTNVTMQSNNALLGGAIANFGGTVSVSNSTLNGNYAQRRGGALYNYNSSSSGLGTATFTNVTFNDGAGFGGGSIGGDIYNNGALTLSNNIFNAGAGGTLFNSGGTVSDNGYNLARDGGGGVLTASTDLLNTDPKLDPRGSQPNGGLTQTIALAANSPAINAGNSPLSTDQRGLGRPFAYPGLANAQGGNGSDIGAFELRTTPPVQNPVVNTTDDHDDGACTTADCTLREAIGAAQSYNTLNQNSGATITFDATVFAQPKTITLSLGELAVLSSKVTITGPKGGRLTVDAGGKSRLFYVASGANITLSNLSLSGGSGTDSTNVGGKNGFGGALFVEAGGSLSLENCVLSGSNASANGGAIFSTGTLNIANTTLSGNSVPSGYGGALLNGGTATVSNSTFTGNSANYGGALSNSGTLNAVGAMWNGNNATYGGAISNTGTATLDRTTITNGGASYGGAIDNSGGANLTLSNSSLNGNTAQLFGGAINNAGTLNISNSTLSNNKAVARDGGALSNSGTATLSNATLSGNSATSGFGGAVLNLSGTVSLTGVTLSGNSASSGKGGDIANTGSASNKGKLNLSNTILNSTPGSTLFNDTTGGTVTDNGYNLARDGGGGVLTASSDLLQTDPQLDPKGLQPNGGSTATLALLAGSAAIDAGNSSISSDQRGFARPVVVAGRVKPSGGNGSDIGAFEFNPAQSGGLVVNTLDDHDDGVCGAGDCTLREAINAANSFNNATGNSGTTITFDAGVSGSAQTLTLSLGELPLLFSNITINGPSAGVTIDAGGKSRHFYVGNSAQATLSNLSLSGGNGNDANATGGNNASGGALFVEDGSTLNLSSIVLSGNTTAFGGAIYSRGTLNIANSTLRANSASFGGGGLINFGVATLTGSTLSGNSARSGGGILSNGTVTISGSTLSGNSATGGTNGSGGALFANGPSSISNSTLSDNSAGTGTGGAIYINRDTMTLSNVTLSGNSARSGGDVFDAATLVLSNTILASTQGGTLDNSFGTVSDNGYNLARDNGGGALTASTDLLNTDPKLGLLQFNGGSTQTRALLLGSPAINAGNTSLTTDQRGVTRPQGSASDIGAYEFVPLKPGSVFISQFRLSGPNGDGDEFIELYNNTDAPLDLTGYSVQESNTGTALLGVNLSGKTMAARGHFLLSGPAYSLGSVYPAGAPTGFATGNAFYSNDLPLSTTLSLINPRNTVVDRVGDLSGFIRRSTDQYAFVRRMESGVPQNTGNEASDFNLVDTSATVSTANGTGVAPLSAARLGAPGPRNSQSPIQRNDKVNLLPLAASVGTPAEGRYASKSSALDNPNGRLTIRRTLTNNLSVKATQVRFRIVAGTNGTTTASGVADLRALTSAGVTVNGTKIVNGITLDAPSTPTVAPSGFGNNPASSGNGGGLNSSWTVDLSNTSSLLLSDGSSAAGGIPAGKSINVEFLFAIVANGNYRVVVDTELLP